MHMTYASGRYAKIDLYLTHKKKKKDLDLYTQMTETVPQTKP